MRLVNAVLLACLGVASAAERGVLAQPSSGQGRALLVAIDDYRLDRLDLPPESSTTDARNLQRLLQSNLGFRPDQIRTLFNEQASKTGILTAIEDWLISGTRPGDRVFFSYSGHGAQQPDTDGDEDDELDETLVSWDTELRDGRVLNMVTDDEISALFQRLHDRHAVIFVDACHSGTISRSTVGPGPAEVSFLRTPMFEPFLSMAMGGLTRGGASRSLAAALTRSGSGDAAMAARAREESFVPSDGTHVVWTAVTPTQVALVERGTDPYQGVFTRRFVRGVSGGEADRNGNGIISHAELLDYLRTESAAYCQGVGARDCQANGGHLTPTLEAPEDYLGRDIVTLTTAGNTAGQVTDTLGKPNVSSALDIEILPSARVRLGDTVQFRLTSAIDGYLLVLDVTADNQVVQLFPNPFSDRTNADRRIVAGRFVTIPDASYGFDFVAQPPTGEGVLVAIVTADPVDLSSLAGQNRGFEPIKMPGGYVAGLAQSLIATWSDQLESRGVDWNLAYERYAIER